MESLPDMLIQSGKNVKDRLERARSTQLMKDMDECTFKPEINHMYIFFLIRVDSFCY